mgnify:CR=1 FL=1
MKKYLLFAATAAMMLAGCSNEVDFTQDDLQQKSDTPTPIQFGTYLGKTGTTRAGTAGQITTETLKTGTHANDGFAVFAFKTGTTAWASADSPKPDFMYNQQVKWDNTNSVWTYSPVKYWPNGDDNANAANNPSNTATEQSAQKLSFFAYAPYVDAAISETTSGIVAINESTTLGGTAPSTDPVSTGTGNQKQGHPTITYSLKRTGTEGSYTYDLSAASNVDLLWGEKGQASYSEASETDGTQTPSDNYNTDLTKFNTSEKVAFNFKHALAKFGGYDGSTALLKVVADVDGNSGTPTTSGFGDNLPANTTLVTLKSISIKPKTTGTEATNNIIMNGKFDITTGVWSRLASGEITAPTTYNLLSTTNATSGETPTATTGVNVQVWEPASAPTYSTEDSKWKNGSSEITGVKSGTPKDVYSAASNGAGAFYFIPFTKGSDGADFTYNPQIEVTVVYIVRTYDDHLATPTGESSACSKVEQTITNYVTLPVLATNKVYTLVMHLGLTSVKFTAEVANWDDGTSGGGTDNTEVIWLPSNVVPGNSVTLAANSTSAVVYAPATNGTFTITLTGCKASTALTSVASSETGDWITYPDSTPSADGEGKVDVAYTLTANSGSTTREGTITISGNDSSSSTFTKTITLRQVAP